MSWRQLHSLREMFQAIAGHTIVEETGDWANVPDKPGGWGWGEFAAVRLYNGQWVVIEHDPGEPDWSEVTPGREGHTEMWIWEGS